jgi:hypothetical protein
LLLLQPTREAPRHLSRIQALSRRRQGQQHAATSQGEYEGGIVMGLMPSWAMSGQAVDAIGDAHLSPGIHYRVLINPLLGLPVVPLSVLVGNLKTMAKGFTRTDITWVDSTGAILTAPFQVTPDNPVTGYLPPGQTCCWAALEGRAANVVGPIVRPPIIDPPVVVRPPIVRPPRVPPIPPPARGPAVGARDVTTSVQPGRPDPTGPLATGPASVVAVQPAQPGASLGAAIARSPVVERLDALVLDRIRQRQLPFRLEGVVATPYGDAPVARRSAAPYHVYASHIERLVVRGSGTVTGVSWLPAAHVRQLAPLRMAPLPTKSGARYAGPGDGPDQGLARVKRGAPQRMGMHESSLAATAAACDPATQSDEIDRVTALIPDPEKALDRLVNDLSAIQQQLASPESVLDENGTVLGTSNRLVLQEFAQGMVDPGIARWVGTLDVDEEKRAQTDDVLVYVVEGLFAPDVSGIRRMGLDSTLSTSSSFTVGTDALKELMQHNERFEQFLPDVKAMGTGPYLVGSVVLAVTVGRPLDVPSAPTLGTPVSGAWLPAQAPTAVRELSLGLEALVPGAGLASAIGQPSSAKPDPRNPEDPPKRRLLLTAQPDPAAITATSGTLSDRLVDERDGTWQIAQADWFGRWSSRAATTFGPATRPRPPRPTFTLTTAPPAIPIPVPTGPLAGSVRIEVSVPPVAGLPAGGRLLSSLRLTVTTGSGAPALTDHPVPTPATPPEVMVVTVPGPLLGPTEVGTVVVTARWRDSAGVDSEAADPKTATLHDPRPPSPVVLPPTLVYTARPDATGRARATLSWAPSAGQAAYRIFFADETTLRAKLEEIAHGVVATGDAGLAPSVSQAQTILTALQTAGDDAPARGAVWAANKARLPRRWWRQLTSQPLPRPGSGNAVFTHDVSGSLTVLALFRIVAVSAASVESDFTSAPLLPRAVPNLQVPPMPSVQVLPIEVGGDLRARLTITVPLGPTPAVRYRLRRATATSDPALMQVVREGAVPPRPTGNPAPQVFPVDDDGSAPDKARTTLSRWVNYTWRVEVQGAPAPGGGPVGEWSSPSPAAATTIMPPDPPGVVTALTVIRDAAGVHVRFQHPDPLAGGATAGYTVDVYRQLAGQSLRLLASVPGQAPPPTGRGTNPADSFDVVDSDAQAVAGTVYRVVVTDPIGRSSPPSDPAVAP